MATKKKSGAKCIKGFFETNVLKLPYFVEKRSEVAICKAESSWRMPEQSRILKKFLLSWLISSQIWLIPLLDDC